jgi:hypothetical protein
MDRRWFLVLALVAVVGLVIAPSVAKAATVSGEVTKVDAAAKSLTCKGADGKEMTCTWDDKTEVTVDGKKGSASDVKVGAHVTCTVEGGKASKIEVSAPKKK